MYWGEQIEAADPSPALSQPALFEFGGQAENFSGKNSGLEMWGQSYKRTVPGESAGKIPESGKIPDLEMRVMKLEKRVSELESRKNSVIDAENFRKTEEIPAENGEIPNVNSLNNNNKNTFNHQDNLIVVAEKIPESGEIPEKLNEEEIDARWDENCDIIDAYRRNARLDVVCVDGKYISYTNYSDDEYHSFLELNPSPELVEFILPRAKDYETAKKWLGYSLKQAKEQLCQQLGFWGPGRSEIVRRDDIHLANIDYLYWNWYLNGKGNGKLTLGGILSQILNHCDEMAASKSGPLNIKYLK
ncbi:MAG: hypothetical protein IJI07_00590 [Flexilinea sp.]|nr:hypothetical protein [Flexilinea sp.]